jgi:hypothetical protein
MKNILKALVLLLLTSQLANAQSKTFYMGLGGSLTSFQDTKYSTLHYGGFGGILELQFKKSSDNSIWSTGLTTTVSQEASGLFDNGKAVVAYPQIHFSYLKSINDQLYVGGRWDILEMYFRSTSGLGNNSIYYNTGSYLSVSGIYKMKIGEKPFEIGLNLGLLSYFKESTGFAFSASQSALEDGDFDYQDEALTNPFGFKYFNVRLPWQHFRMNIVANYQLSKRFSLGYRWNIRRFSEVDDYPVTSGGNTISVRYHFTNKSTIKAEN